MIEILRQFMPGDEVRLRTNNQFNNRVGTIKALYSRSIDQKRGPRYIVDLKDPAEDEQGPFIFFGTEMALPYYFQISDCEYIKVYAGSQCAAWNLIAQTNPAVPQTGRFIDRPLSPDHTCVATIHELPSLRPTSKNTCSCSNQILSEMFNMRSKPGLTRSMTTTGPTFRAREYFWQLSTHKALNRQ